MQQNERTYRQLHPRVIDARPVWTWRERLLIGACALLAWTIWGVLMLALLFWLNSPCAVCGR